MAGFLRVAAPLATAAVVIAVAEILKRAGWMPVFIPAPSEVVGEALRTPALVTGNLFPSLRTAALGYLLAMVITLLAASLSTLVHQFKGPVYSIGVVINAVPIIATAPLLALWLGNGQDMQVVITALTTQFPMLVGAMQGLSSIDERQRELFYVLSASPWQIFRQLRLPSALPYIFTGLKVAAPLAVLGATTAEWAGADRGIGAMMLYALFSYDTPKVWLAVVLCCAVASASYGLMALLERLCVAWARPQEGMS